MRVKDIWWSIRYIFEGMAIALSGEEDPELWDNPRKKARIRRKMRRERG
jgi:hypothetical protein